MRVFGRVVPEVLTKLRFGRDIQNAYSISPQIHLVGKGHAVVGRYSLKLTSSTLYFINPCGPADCCCWCCCFFRDNSFVCF